MKDDEKLRYVDTHICEIEESIETIKKNLKWISSNVKFIKKISKPKDKN